ncbi:hypothetical protein Ddye_004606 [Dipteronia dyeriana]|uniref:Uncharacterized protein n=1 Tax=Dipteronia dyeriana TaxID=168575 RepID=A0AAD9XW85_9ROSI|nr:hypothetical protein Ddye_004606 [Dipteronia dyeriana]
MDTICRLQAIQTSKLSAYSQNTKLITSKKPSVAQNIRPPPSNLVEVEELFPINSPALGNGASASELGEAAELEEGKNDDIWGAVTYGKTAGDAEITGSQVEHMKCRVIKKMIVDKTADNLVIVAMVMGEFEGFRWLNIAMGLRRVWLFVVAEFHGIDSGQFKFCGAFGSTY